MPSNKKKMKKKIGMLLVDSLDAEKGVSDGDAQEDIKKLVKEQETAKGMYTNIFTILLYVCMYIYTSHTHTHTHTHTHI